MDRTLEFRKIVAARKGQRQPTAAVPPPPQPSKRSEFAALASAIGSDTYAAVAKLAKLTQLAQSKSLFEDPTVEINELTHIIKQDITALNARLSDLQSAMASAAAAGGAKQRATHSTSVVDSLKTKLYDATREFQDVLHTRSNNIQLLQTRREQFSGVDGGGGSSSGGSNSSGTVGGGGGGSSSLAGSAAAGGSFGAPDKPGGFGTPRNRFAPPAPIFELLPPPPPSAASSGGGGVFGGGGHGAAAAAHKKDDDNHGPPITWASPASKPAGMSHTSGGEVVIDMGSLGEASRQMQQAEQLQMNTSYLDSRAQAVNAVQSTIVELGGIFQQLAEVVAAQGQMLQRVDENIDDSLVNVREGHAQIQRYWRSMSTNRGLMMKVFAILFFFIVVWGTLFA